MTDTTESAPVGKVPRRMLEFDRDPTDEPADARAASWIVRLDCGHRRHVRHRPPLSDYPWLLDAATRAAKLGATIECERCARLELPDGAAEYRHTDVFDEHSLPAGLRRAHTTKTGTWGRVEVLAGRLRFVLPLLAIDRVVEAGEHAIIPPELEHFVEPLGEVRMRVVFLRVG